MKGIGLRFNTYPRFYKILLIIIISIFIISLFPVEVLLISDYKTDEYIKSWKIEEGEHFTVEYTHSVQLTPVSETYIIKEGKITLIESYFKSYGAGLPATTPYKFQVTDKGFRIYEIDKVIESLIYRTGGEGANHKLLVKDKEFNFLDFSKPRSGIKFNVKTIRFLTYIGREILYER